MHVILLVITLFFSATPTMPAHHVVVVAEAPSNEACGAAAPIFAQGQVEAKGAAAADWVCAEFTNPLDKPT